MILVHKTRVPATRGRHFMQLLCRPWDETVCNIFSSLRVVYCYSSTSLGCERLSSISLAFRERIAPPSQLL